MNTMNSTFCLGDIHGEYEKMMDLLNKLELVVGDTLIFLGDYVDRGKRSFEVIDELIRLKGQYNVITLKGNHDDEWLTSLQKYKEDPSNFVIPFPNHGSYETLDSYRYAKEDPLIHLEFFENLLPYYEMNNMFFVHGGFNRHFTIKENEKDPFIFWWDRDLWNQALSYEHSTKEFPFKMKDEFDKIFIGHTPTNMWRKRNPMKAANIWNVDTGCGKYEDALLSAINVSTEKIIQSYDILH